MLKFRYCLSNVCAAVANFCGYRRSVIDINMARSFPELKYAELDKLRSEYYRYMFDLIFESVWAMFASQKKLCQMVTMANPELMDALSAKYGKIVLMMGHLGNWELVGALTGDGTVHRENDFALNNIYLTYKKPNHKLPDRFFYKMRMHAFKKSRNKGGVIESKKVLLFVAKQRRLKEGANYIFIADQSPKDNKCVTNFLNHSTPFFMGPEYIAKKLGAPVVYLGMDRVDRGRYVIKFTLIEENSANTPDGEITKKFAHYLQEDIKENKVNWLWSHKRWKRDVTV